MSEQVVFDNEWGTLRYNSAHKYVHHTIHKPIGGKELYAMLEKGYEALKQNDGHKWLSDDRKNGELSAEDAEYGLTNWGPRMADIGWKYWALVVPESIAGRAAMQQVIEAYWGIGVRVAVFTDLNKARTWLESQ